MRLSLRFILPLLLILTAIAYGVAPLVDQFTLRWSVRDLDQRSAIIVNAIAEPLAGVIDQKMEEGGKELQCIKTTLLASMQGYAPATAIEFGRKVLNSTERPTFSELEGHVKGKK